MSSRKGLALLGRAKSSPHGWSRVELDRLYKSYGFTIFCGRKHDIVKHPEFLELRATLTRSSGELHPDYIRHAVEMIENLMDRQKGLEDD